MLSVLRHRLNPHSGPRSCRMRSNFTHMRRPYVQRNHKTGWAWRVRSVNFAATFDVPLRQLPPGVNLCATVWHVHVCRRNMAGRVYFRLLMRWNFRRQRILRDHTNPFDIYDDVELFARFRFRQEDSVTLVDLFGDELEHPLPRGGSLPPLMQVLVALRFLPQGHFSKRLGICSTLTDRL